MADQEYEILDWEVDLDEGDDSSDFRLLPEGVYPYKVVSVAKGFTNKTPSYPMANLTLKVGVGPESATVTDRIPMHSGAKWKLAQLSVSLGVRKHGEKKKFSVADTVGMTGWLEIDHVAGQKDPEKMFNNVARYIDPEDAPADGKPVIKGDNAEKESWV